MPGLVDRYPARVIALRREHNYLLVQWVSRRIVERIDIDVTKLLHSAESYIDWSALVMDAAIVNLTRRRWTQTARALQTRASQSLQKAKLRPSDDPDGMPTLLKSAFLL